MMHVEPIISRAGIRLELSAHRNIHVRIFEALKHSSLEASRFMDHFRADYGMGMVAFRTSDQFMKFESILKVEGYYDASPGESRPAGCDH